MNLRVTVDQKRKLPGCMIKADLYCVAFALVPVVSYYLEFPIFEFFDDLSRPITATIINDDYFVVFRYRFKLSFRISNASFDTFGFVVCGHDNGYSIFYETLD